MFELFEFLTPSDPSLVVECSESTGCTAIHSVVASVIVFFVLLTGFAYTTVLERRFIAWVQDRIGPNRAGPLGLLQPVADAIKLIFKQDVTPSQADRYVYWIAPIIKLIPALIVLAVVPFGPSLVVPWFDGNWYRIAQGITDLNVGVLWILSVTSISVYGVTMAGWASANKYAMLGSLRSAASMISYELSLGATFAVAAMLAGSLSVGDIVEAQSGNLIFNWFIFQNPLAAILMFVALMAEINRAPFDLPEAEQELVAGHMTEYSGMKFAMFFMAEYINMIGVSIIFSSMFLGGYNLILTDQFPLLGPLWLTGKVIALLTFMIWIRATLPRFRYDRLMQLGWKVALPLSLIALNWTATIIVLSQEYDSQIAYLVATAGLFVMIAIAVVIFGRSGAPEVKTSEEVEVISVGGHGLGYVLVQFIGSLIAAPMMLYQYSLDVAQNLRNAVGTTKPQEDEQETSEEASGAPQLPESAGD